MHLDPKRLKNNILQASTEDLLDRATVYRNGMEAIALDWIDAELRRRGIDTAAIEAHAAMRAEETSILEDGTAAACTFCERPACAEGWAWHKLWGRFPLFPRYCRYCAKHRPDHPREPAEVEDEDRS